MLRRAMQCRCARYAEVPRARYARYAQERRTSVYASVMRCVYALLPWRATIDNIASAYASTPPAPRAFRGVTMLAKDVIYSSRHVKSARCRYTLELILIEQHRDNW